ncbi:MAG: type II asparaginase [Rubrivivax sp.]|nr:type II asparaginase [Rubrivivax sp.]
MKRRVHVLGTGGTIAGAQPDPGHYGYTAARYGIDWLLNAVPGLDRLASLSGEQVVNIGSQDMDDGTWLSLARRLNAVLAEPATDAALITHGTDTLEETGYFLSLVTAGDKPVVMVGSMRPATAISADGPANIYNGVAVAADAGAVGRGALIVLNDEIHHARNAVKTGTSNPNAFSSMSRGLAGITSAGRVEWFEREPARTGAALRFDVGALQSLPRVDILHAHAGMSVDLIDAAIAAGARGIVVAGVGAGNMSAPAIERLARAAAQGTVVVRSSRVVSAMVLRNAEIDDDRLGFVAAGDLNAPKSRVLLALALTRTSDPGRIQSMFDQG